MLVEYKSIFFMHGIGLLAGPVTLELFHELPANDHP